MDYTSYSYYRLFGKLALAATSRKAPLSPEEKLTEQSILGRTLGYWPAESLNRQFVKKSNTFPSILDEVR